MLKGYTRGTVDSRHLDVSERVAINPCLVCERRKGKQTGGSEVDAAVQAGWLHKNTITGDFADVKGLRNSNDNYL